MDEEYLGLVLDLVAAVPPGRAVTYGLLAELVTEELVRTGRPARGGPRQVGQVLARAGGGVPWWRVVNASGRPPARWAVTAVEHWRQEGTPLVRDGSRVQLATAVWWPHPEPGASG
ncbi:MAG: MGMT family protein [Actinobacteria bacterium]|nr:MGMT family protein [Actinomycetota bacterium]MCG2799778.1 MGMT family protein [Cellulomonas sp.]